MKKLSTLKRKFDELPESRKEIALHLLQKAAFVEEEMNKLEEVLKEKGWVEKYKNGENQYGLKKSSEGDVYISLSKTYAGYMRQLNDIIPTKETAADELLEFLDE